MPGFDDHSTFDYDTFDHTSDEHGSTWRERFAVARASCPVIHSKNHGGYYVITRHADVMAVLGNPSVFSSERSWDADGNDYRLGATIPHTPIRVGFLDMDPPEHTKYRKLMNGWFTKPAVTRGRERIAQIATWAVDQVIEAGRCEVVFDLAGPFQVVMFLDLMGIPIQRWTEYAAVAHQIHGSSDPDDRPKGIKWLHDELEAEVARQRSVPGSGLMSEIATAEVDGELLTLEVATELCVMLLLGGELTTIATISHMVNYLYENPDQRTWLRENPDATPAAVDEVLRYYSPSMGIARTVVEPAEVGGQAFEPGDRLLIAYGSANLDEDVFENAQVLDLTRRPNPHLAFGRGIHRCIGSQLAHTNVQLMVNEILHRMPDYAVVAAHAFERVPTVNAYHSMTIEYSPGPRVGTVEGQVPALTADPIRPS